MLNTTNSRLFIGVPAATAIVYGLFALMGGLISVDEIEFEDVEPRILEPIRAEEKPEEKKPTRPTAKQIETPNKPPPPPALSNSQSDIDLPVISLDGQAPQQISFNRRVQLSILPTAIDERSAKPLSPPIVPYPERAIGMGLEGQCDVRFDVDVRGRPTNVEATCSHSVFRAAAERGVKGVQFAPRIDRGEAKERRNVVYPITFRLPD